MQAKDISLKRLTVHISRLWEGPLDAPDVISVSCFFCSSARMDYHVGVDLMSYQFPYSNIKVFLRTYVSITIVVVWPKVDIPNGKV
jgi:hypothetical protein